VGNWKAKITKDICQYGKVTEKAISIPSTCPHSGI
jgi:hypothetical protein